MDIPLQQDLSNEIVSTERGGRALWSWILFPGIAVMLGWGLRGYIGGGPFAAMIPGAFLAMSLSLLLGHERKTAALLALFGAVSGFMSVPDAVWLSESIPSKLRPVLRILVGRRAIHAMNSTTG